MFANAFDVDGDYKWTEFLVNGANAMIQFKEQHKIDDNDRLEISGIETNGIKLIQD